VRYVNEIPAKITSVTDGLMNRDTLLTFGGVGAFLGLGYSEQILHSMGIDFGLPRKVAISIAVLPPALPIFKGAAGNLREFFPLRKILRLQPDLTDDRKMALAGVSLHFAGEYAQSLAIVLGGPDFGASFPDASSMHDFLFDPHNIPYWSLNIPGIFLLGKAIISSPMRTVHRVRLLIKELREAQACPPETKE